MELKHPNDSLALTSKDQFEDDQKMAVEAIVSTTVEILGNMLIQEANFLSGVGNEVRSIQGELKRMQGILKDADKRQYEDESFRTWVRSLRLLAYRTENVVETYAIKVESRKRKGIINVLKRSSCLLHEGANLHKIGLEIRDIKNEISSLGTSLQTYGIDLKRDGESSNAASKNLLRQTFPHEIEEHFVEVNNNVDSIVSFLIDGNKNERIISLYGMGGLGKTTLARRVFNDKNVQNHFECFAWVTVSQQYMAESILQEILSQIDPINRKDDIKRMEYRELVQKLYEVQKGKKCLVVVDDIWRKEDWTILSRAFPINLDTKLVLTTRKQEVAEIGICHTLKLFTEEQGWGLLRRKSFTNINAEDSSILEEKEKLGKEMVYKCGYLPLAISVIGGILSKKESVEEWKKVNKDIDSYLIFNEGVEEDYRVTQILTLSYDDLPYQLKPCLLYLAYFPEDTNIDVQSLFLMWIAEGMILLKDQIKRDDTLMRVADRYLHELARRSLVQIQPTKPIVSGSYQYSCRLHDLIRDLCIRKCKDDDFLKIMDFRGSRRPLSDLNYQAGNAYRLVIYGAEADTHVDEKILPETNINTRLFAFRYLSRFINPVSVADQVLENLANLSCLKVIVFEGLKFPNTKLLHKAVKKLIHLRFLSFQECELDELPSSVANLPYLQTLHCDHSFKVPNVLWKLKRLIHLVLFSGDYTLGGKIKLRLDCLSGLETLIFGDPYFPEGKDLSKLTNLRIFNSLVKDNETLSLVISCAEAMWVNIEDITLRIYPGCNFISKAAGSILLHKLFLCGALQCLIIFSVRIRELPKYQLGELNVSHLVNLEMTGCSMEEDPMPTLEKLPKLENLCLGRASYDGEELICSSIGFPNLRDLQLYGLMKLKKWRIDEGAMPNIVHVFIGECFKLEMIPDGMKFLTTLKKLTIQIMPVEFNNRIDVVNGQEGADLHKIRHVPSINIVPYEWS